MIDPSAREMLRNQALAAWDLVTTLQRDAVRLTAEAEVVTHLSQEQRASHGAQPGAAAETFGSPVAGLFPDNVSSDHPSATGEFNYLADQAIRRWTPMSEDREAGDGGVGLVASRNHPILVHLEQIARSRLVFVVRAHDAGTALGLAISTQPDIAIIDARLDLAHGADLVVALPRYAPRTKTLLLTSNAAQAAKVRPVGVDILSPRASRAELLRWVASAAA